VMERVISSFALLFWLLVVGLLVSVASNPRAQETSTQQITKATATRQDGNGASVIERSGTTTEKLSGCLKKAIEMDGYLLIGPHSDEWILKSDSVDLSAYCSRWVRVTVLQSPYNEGPLSVVAVEVERDRCTGSN